VVFHAEPAKQTHRTQSRLEESDTDRGAAPTWHGMQPCWTAYCDETRRGQRAVHTGPTGRAFSRSLAARFRNCKCGWSGEKVFNWINPEVSVPQTHLCFAGQLLRQAAAAVVLCLLQKIKRNTVRYRTVSNESSQ
jgi:hypothetical protein